MLTKQLDYRKHSNNSLRIIIVPQLFKSYFKRKTKLDMKEIKIVNYCLDFIKSIIESQIKISQTDIFNRKVDVLFERAGKNVFDLLYFDLVLVFCFHRTSLPSLDHAKSFLICMKSHLSRLVLRSVKPSLRILFRY